MLLIQYSNRYISNVYVNENNFELIVKYTTRIMAILIVN